MNLTEDRMRSIGWGVFFVIAVVMTLVLTFRVNAVKSEVRLSERQIVALKREKLLLETEFETRANQQQLRALNEVEFGYQAPTADQYLEGERQLLALGKERGPDAPKPIQVAALADEDAPSSFSKVVSPLVGKPLVAASTQNGTVTVAANVGNAKGIGERLSHGAKQESLNE